MSENAAFIKMLLEGEWHEGDINYDDLLRAASLIERLEAELTELRAHSELLREALTSISTALDAYGVRWCRDVAKDALLQEKGE